MHQKETGTETVDSLEECSSSVKFAHKNKLRKMKKNTGVSSIQPLNGQKYLVASFLPDATFEIYPELLFQVYGAFGTENEADHWIRHVLSDTIKDVNIDIVDVCQWLFPQKLKSSDFGKEEFRSLELDKVMKYHKAEPSKVKQFEEWNKTQT